MMQFMDERKKQGVRQYRQPDVCGIRLTGYADSFRELAKSFEREEPKEASDRRALFEEERLRENCSVIAGHLNELADIIEQTAGEISGLEPLEDKVWRKLSHAFREEGILLEGACLVPGREKGSQISLQLQAQGRKEIPCERVEAILRFVLGKKYCLSLSSEGSVGQQSQTYLFVEQPEYMAFTGFARVVKGREEISGDNYSILESERGKLTLLLSDGTGSGEKASQGSSWTLDLAEKFLESGYSPEAAMRLINATAVTRAEEVGHPTLDMCFVDLHKGCCDFCKAGGAVSFRKRGKEIEQISGGKLPLGIFPDLEPHRQYLQLKEGDSIILMTDGVLEAFREKGYEEAVRNCLAELEDENPRDLAEKLMQLAIFVSEGNIRDDMMILTATLWKNP